MSLSQEDRDAIIKAAAEETNSSFENEVAIRTSLTTAQVLALAKSEDEKKALALVLSEVTKATGSNKAKADAIRNIAGGVEALVKVVSKLI